MGEGLLQDTVHSMGDMVHLFVCFAPNPGYSTDFEKSPLSV
jgi:hypothetical protein